MCYDALSTWPLPRTQSHATGSSSLWSRGSDWSARALGGRTAGAKGLVTNRWFLGFNVDMSLARTINHIRNGGFAKYWRDMQYIGDAKWGRMVGLDRYVDAHGNETDAA